MIAAFAVIFAFAEEVASGDKGFPFSPGEKLTFQAKWGPIPAAEGVLQVLPTETVHGIKSRHFMLTIKTYPFIDFFYKVRDRIDAYTDVEMTHSILYKKRKQGKSRKHVVVNFFWDKNKAQYSNFGKKRKPISILPGSFDPLSVFYAFRLRKLEENLEMEGPVTDGKKCVIGRARVVRREKIRIANGTYDTYLVEPELRHIGGVFEKSRNARLQVWVTADERRIPVRVKSRVVVGSFVGELISLEQTPVGPPEDVRLLRAGRGR
jgi:hypothetical protein